MLLSNGTTWVLLDVSDTVTAQLASNIQVSPAGNIASTNVQSALQELDDEKLPLAGGTLTGNLALNTGIAIVYEGATTDNFETTLYVVDPTADRTILLPDVSGTVVTTGDTGTVTSTMLLDGTILNEDINASAAIVDTKLATIATGGKVSGTAITSGNISTSGSFTSTSTVTGTNLIPTGSGVPTNGIYLPAANSVAVATNGTRRLLIDSAGALTLDTGDATIYGVRVGRGASAISTNTVVGNDALTAITTGGLNTAMGGNALKANTDGIQNTAVGYNALIANTSGSYNTAYGLNALFGNTTGSYNTCIGNPAGIALTTGSNNTIIGCVGGTAGLADTVIIAAGGTERLRIDSSGRLGIGTSSPNETLHVNGAIRFTSNSPVLAASDGGVVDWVAATGELRVTAARTGANSSKIGFITYNSGSLVQAATIDSAGRLGIGTTSPSSALEVYATAPVLTVNSAVANASSIVLQQNGTTYARFRFDGNNVDIGNLYVGGATIFNAGNAERARIDYSGRLLVGTSTARSNINHRGSVGITPNVQFETATASYSGGLSIINNSTTGNAATLTLGTSKGGGIGSNTIVGDNEQTGTISFSASDGTNFIDCAQVRAEVDGTPGANDMPGRLVFSTTADGGSSPTERMRITSTGQVRLAGAGITFNGDTAAANELDDYEEGTWTPSVGGTATYSDQNGTYTKIGRTVTINFSLNITLLGTGSNNTISGLPFYVGSAGYGATGYFSGLAINVIGLTCNVTGTTVLFNSINASGSTATNNPAILGNSCLIQGSATYFV